MQKEYGPPYVYIDYFFAFLFFPLSLSLPIYYTKSFPLGNRAPLGVATTDERCNGIDDKGKKTMQP